MGGDFIIQADVAAEVETLRGKTVADLVSEPQLLKLIDYWCTKRQGRAMPSKEDIDPVEIAWALNRIFLMDYRPDDGFRYRLAGVEIAKVFGHANLKGLGLQDILPPEAAEMVEARWMPLVRDRCLLSMAGMVYLAAERSAVGERILLPLADDPAGPVTGALGMTVCEWLGSEAPVTAHQARLTTLPVDEVP